MIYDFYFLDNVNCVRLCVCVHVQWQRSGEAAPQSLLAAAGSQSALPFSHGWILFSFGARTFHALHHEVGDLRMHAQVQWKHGVTTTETITDDFLQMWVSFTNSAVQLHGLYKAGDLAVSPGKQNASRPKYVFCWFDTLQWISLSCRLTYNEHVTRVVRTVAAFCEVEDVLTHTKHSDWDMEIHPLYSSSSFDVVVSSAMF